jgi:hypothetical protein
VDEGEGGIRRGQDSDMIPPSCGRHAPSGLCLSYGVSERIVSGGGGGGGGDPFKVYTLVPETRDYS